MIQSIVRETGRKGSEAKGRQALAGLYYGNSSLPLRKLPRRFQRGSSLSGLQRIYLFSTLAVHRNDCEKVSGILEVLQGR